MVLRALLNTVKLVVEALTGLEVENVEVHTYAGRRLYVAVVKSSAREALEKWLRCAEEFKKMGLLVLPKWLGETDVTVDELDEYLARLYTKLGIKIALEGVHIDLERE